MRTVRSIAVAITLAAGGALVVAPIVGKASPKCPSPTQTAGATQAAAREVTEDFPTIQAAAGAVGVPMTSNRQVIAVMAYPTFVDTRVVASDDPCRIIGVATTTGAHPNATGNPLLVWTPPFPTFSGGGVGERFVSSTEGSITIEFRESPTAPWRRYVATSTAMRWTAGGALPPEANPATKVGSKPISAKERSELGAAIKRTLSAKSVRIDVRWPSGDGSTRSITLNRPDRSHTETVLLDGTVVQAISIGRDSYESWTSAEGKWTHTRPRITPLGTFESTLGLWLEVDKFGSRDGSSFVGEMSDGGSLFGVKAQLSGGRVVQLSVTMTSPNPVTRPRSTPSVMRLTLFDKAARVVAPPADKTGAVRH